MSFLLDTNVISEIRKRERADIHVTRWVMATSVTDMYTSVVALAEIRRGIVLKRRSDAAQAEILERWYGAMRAGLEDRVLPITETVAEAWAELSPQNPLPLFDALLAATARVHGLVLVTRNVADFARAGVPILNPFDAGAP